MHITCNTLDADAEHDLFRRWAQAAGNATTRNGGVTVLVSHRLSTVRMADLVVVLSKGRVAETGTHDDLIRRGGRYAEMYRLQAFGKHRRHGLLFLALTDENGNLIWISAARRGAASEITAARRDRLAAQLRQAGLGALADLGFTGLDPDPDDPVIITGWKAAANRKLTPAQRQANRVLSAARAPVEHGFADLNQWRILTRLRLSPARATTVLRALLVLTRPAHHPLTDDHELCPAAPASASTARPRHTRHLTSQFKLKQAQCCGDSRQGTRSCSRGGGSDRSRRALSSTRCRRRRCRRGRRPSR